MQSKQRSRQRQSSPASASPPQVLARPNTAAPPPSTSAARTSVSPAGSWSQQFFSKEQSTPPAPSGPDRASRLLPSAGGTQLLRNSTRVPKESVASEEPPVGAKYPWSLSRLYDKHPNLFAKAPECRVSPEADGSAFVVDPSVALKLCQQCQRRRDTRGLGNVFCHECSGIDQGPLNKSLLYPVLQRRRLKLMMASDIPLAHSSQARDVLSSGRGSADADGVDQDQERRQLESESATGSRAVSKDEPLLSRAGSNPQVNAPLQTAQADSRRGSRASNAKE